MFKRYLLSAAYLSIGLIVGGGLAAANYSIQDLGDLATDEVDSTAEGINAHGAVVGWSWTDQTRSDGLRIYRAFLYKEGIMQDLGVLPAAQPASEYRSEATAINDLGEVVGSSENGEPGPYGMAAWRAFFRDATTGAMVDLGTTNIGNGNSFAAGINNRSQVIGTVLNSDGPKAFLWTATGGVVDLTAASGERLWYAQAINDAGLVVGQSSAGHAALFKPQTGEFKDLGTFAGENDQNNPYRSDAWGINNLGQVVGYSELGEKDNDKGEFPRHAFLWTAEEGMRDLGTLAGLPEASSEASGINDAGQIVGWSRTSNEETHAFIYANGQMSDLGLLNHYYAEAHAINQSGQVVGKSRLFLSANEAVDHAVLWTPSATAAPPSLGDITTATNPLAINTILNVSASFTDPDVGDTHTATWDWGDGSTSGGTVDEVAGAVSGSHIYNLPGVYILSLTVTDAAGLEDTATYEYVVVYDPNGGFVTGGGWIISPPGAYPSIPSLTGKVTFGFNAKYRKGASIPKGQTKFRFKAAGLKFHSTAYEWIVVAGTKAQFKGIGTINGRGPYSFLLTAIDGGWNKGVDKFRVKIWNDDGIVYDNKLGSGDNSEDATALGGGGIIIHK